MNAEDALVELGIELPYYRKLSCPKHSDSDPSLHVYPGDKGWYCFSCGRGGDGWDLLALYYDRPVGEIMREHGQAFGPRPRSRWEMVNEVQVKARRLGWSFTVAVRSIAPVGFLQSVAERVDTLWPWVWDKEVDESIAPVQLERELDQIDKFYADETNRANAIMSLPRPADVVPHGEAPKGGGILEVRSA